MAKEKEPFELWKKAFLVGLGATAVTVEKIQELANELVERGEMTQKDAKSFSEDLKERAMKEKEQLEKKVKDTVETQLSSAVKSLGLVTKADFDKLKKELDSLKAAGKAPKKATSSSKK